MIGAIIFLKSFVLFIWVQTQRVSWYQEYFQRRGTEGKGKMHIIVAVGRKLLSAFYAMLKNGTVYDPNWEDNRRLAPARL